MTSALITGTMLRDLVLCERRVHHDLHSDPALRDDHSDFVRMLWQGGREHERDVLSSQFSDAVDLRDCAPADRQAQTQLAMADDCKVILGGMISHGDRVGMPDVLERRHDGWTAGDVKWGSPTELCGNRPRLEYAVQVAHYNTILEMLGAGSGQQAFVLGRDGTIAPYDLHSPWGRTGQSIAAITTTLTDTARSIRDRLAVTLGAASAQCKLCHWHSICERELTTADDTTLIAGVGRSVRDALAPFASSVAALAELDIEPLRKGAVKPVVPGVGTGRLIRFRDRARLLRSPGATAYAMRPLGLTAGHREIHFDIETHPLLDGFVYLHGFLVREPVANGYSTRYHSIFAEDLSAEADAFSEAMQFLSADPSAHIYYYSKFERSSFRGLADRHSYVRSRADVDAVFDPSRATDLLFDVIMPHTEWPTSNLSIKTLARHLGFDWRDADASGAASIAWFDEYLKTSSADLKGRILAYNEDDVEASAVVLDGLRALPVKGPPSWPPPQLQS